MRSGRNGVRVGAKLASLLILAFIAAVIVVEPAMATGLQTTCQGTASTPAQRYCLDYGGCPRSGNCYFPDGSYCDLEAFYRGECPDQAAIEQSLWEREMYYWLYGEDLYTPPFRPHLTPIYVPRLYPEDSYYYPGYYPDYYPDYYPGPYPDSPTGYRTYGQTVYGSAAYWKGEADQRYLAGNYEEAVAMYTRALDVDPTLNGARLNLGHSLYLLGRYMEALNAYEAVLRADPRNYNAWNGKGLALNALGRPEEGRSAMEKAKSLTPVVLGRGAETGTSSTPLVLGSQVRA